MDKLPFVSIIIPCKNEVDFLEGCIDSILASDYPEQRMEILVVDGMSTDGSRPLVNKYANKSTKVYLLDNPRSVTPVALNIGLKNAKGEILIRMDAHAMYPHDYISECVKAISKYDMASVGGSWNIKPRTNNFIARLIIAAFSHKFGVGNNAYRLSRNADAQIVDTVPYFCCTRNTLETFAALDKKQADLALFNEDLVRGQDMDFNNRLRKVGGKVVLVPSISSFYFARTELFGMIRHYFVNGIWAILPILYSKELAISKRHLVPLVFNITLTIAIGLSLISTIAVWVLAIIISSYTIVSLISSIDIAIKKRDPRYALCMPLIFLALHMSYGLGSLYGVFKVATKFLAGAIMPKRNENIV